MVPPVVVGASLTPVTVTVILAVFVPPFPSDIVSVSYTHLTLPTILLV